MRLNRYLSQCGLGSRRGCEQLILEGRVSINGHVLRDLATQVNPEDRVVADGKPVKAETGVVIALHKPRGYICSRSDEKDRMTIYSLLPKQFQTLHHVGRLDKDSEGLLLMTNRGDLSHRLIHPSMGAEKEYEVIVDQPMDQATMAKLVKGMLTEEGYAKCERAWMITEYRAHLVLKQGLKRQIRLMLYQLGFEVERLIRTRIGWLELKNLQKGGWKQLTEAEVERFFSKDGATGRPARKPKSRPTTKNAEDTQAEGEDPELRPRRSVAKKQTAARDGRSRPRTAERDRPADRSRAPGARSRFNRDSSSSGRRDERERSGSRDSSRSRTSEREDRPGRREDRTKGPRSGKTGRTSGGSGKRGLGKKGPRKGF